MAQAGHSDNESLAAPTESQQLARARQATETVWLQIEAEFGLLTGAEVAELLDAAPSDQSIVSSKHAEHQIAGVLRVDMYLYPGYQFDRERGEILPVIGALLELALANQWDETSFLLWMVGPSTHFEDSRRPVDHLGEPEVVLAAARNEFEAEW